MSIGINGFISELTAMDTQIALSMRKEKDGDNDDPVCVNIATKGGDFFSALNIYNMLRESGKKVVTCAQGICASAGAVILLSGDEICAAENSLIMFHNPAVNLEAVDSQKLDKVKEDLKKCEDVLNLTISNRCGWKEEKTKKFLDSAQYLTAKEAKKMGIIDKILPFVRKKVVVDNTLPVEVLNFAETANKEVDRMNLKDVCGKLSIEVKDDTTDDQMVAMIVEQFANFEGQIAEAKGTVTELQNKVTALEAAAPKKKVSLPATIINMVKRSRDLEVSSLVTEGKITPVVANELKNIFITDEAINSAADENGEVRDSFDKTIDALRKNETVLNFVGKSGTQQLPKTSEDANVLIRDAEKRNKE